MDAVWLVWISLLNGASSPAAARNAVKASPTGSRAATSAPKAKNRITRVIGSESTSA